MWSQKLCSGAGAAPGMPPCRLSSAAARPWHARHTRMSGGGPRSRAALVCSWSLRRRPWAAAQDKLEPSEGLGDLLKRAGDPEAALACYQKANVPGKVIEGLAAKGDFEALSKFTQAQARSCAMTHRSMCGEELRAQGRAGSGWSQIAEYEPARWQFLFVVGPIHKQRYCPLTRVSGSPAADMRHERRAQTHPRTSAPPVGKARRARAGRQAGLPVPAAAHVHGQPGGGGRPGQERRAAAGPAHRAQHTGRRVPAAQHGPPRAPQGRRFLKVVET